MFAEHTIESAPPAARRAMTATKEHLGYLPAGVARLAASPQLLDGFLKLTAMFEGTTLDPVAQEVVVMTIATQRWQPFRAAISPAPASSAVSLAVCIATQRWQPFRVAIVITTTSCATGSRVVPSNIAVSLKKPSSSCGEAAQRATPAGR